MSAILFTGLIDLAAQKCRNFQLIFLEHARLRRWLLPSAVINGLPWDGTSEQFVEVNGAVAEVGQNFNELTTNGALGAPGKSLPSGETV